MTRQGNVGAQREAQLERSHYTDDSNFTPEHLYSMSFQIRQLHAMRARRVLEIGIGNGFVSTFLRQAGVEVVTADINPALKPDVCAPLQELPQHLKGERFDAVSCCEVLEHMPFEQFGPNLDIIRGLADQAFISLPGHFPWVGVMGRMGIHNRFVDVSLGMRIPCRRRLTDGHYWEIASEWRTRRSALVAHMRERFAQVDSGVFPMHRYHYWFRCSDKERA
ncbi:class I SAM-dependent methyltransferase [Diaphorobacter sp.]|uniref:class I SAM-dependent methyltransferase n=1 Tax=Diaphorobacter sp. TaxID=1934310 RepID=UPI0028A8F7B4|nr:methyltransferase domain-containing protein [Diaphorobacter sp.]